MDDGPATVDEALELALASHASGVTKAVATPHFSESYPTSSEETDAAAADLRAALIEAACPLELLTGAEISIQKLPELDSSGLRERTLGNGSCLLIESPFEDAPDGIELLIHDLMVEGFTVLLAHPERSGYFHARPGVFEALVNRGVMCSLTARSFTGQFGRTVRSTSLDMAQRGLVANISSDSHDVRRRPPGLGVGDPRPEGIPSQERLDGTAARLLLEGTADQAAG